ncbi:hypothetical protein C5167_037341 [Papaver somniferum]|uniref:EGF-like domain-containing protein n=1 Tax=Papaver somniferum TaxID=3469 RepID=A0A4Y7I9S6_PAPSO|nr:hypothetical protein C5167_037341 [Papaver somniferum]
MTLLTSSVPSFFGAKAGCDATCGNISIPYPFGMITPGGYGCSIDGAGIGYQLFCNTSFQPPELFLGTGSIETELRIKTIQAIICYNKFGNVTLDKSVAWSDISVSRFKFSYTKNVFFAIGCKSYASIYGPNLQDYSISCSSDCNSRESVMDGSCFGQGCCQSTIPKGLNRYEIGILNSTSKDISAIASFNPCSYGFIAEQNSYTFSASDILDGSNFISKGKDIPMVLDWAVGNKTCEEAEKDLTSFACQENSYCINSDNNPGYRCTCNNGYAGNPYLSPGCQDINECEAQSPCVGICTNTMGSYNCSCPKGSLGDGRKGGSGCFQNNQKFPVLKISLVLGYTSV